MDPRAARVQAALRQQGLNVPVREFPRTTRTSLDAAEAVGVSVAQIVKSLVFLASEEEPLLVLASGAHRVDPSKVAALFGRPVRLARPSWVEAHTGYPVGGVPPIGHSSPLPVIMDRTLLAYPEVWAAGGHSQAVFPIPPRTLAELTHARIGEIAVSATHSA